MRTGASLRIEPLAGAASIPAAEWNALASRGFHLHRWFIAAEEGGWKARHLAVRGSDGLRAVVPAYLEGTTLFGDLHDRWFGPLRHVFARAGLRLRPTLAVVLPPGAASRPLGELDALPDSTVHEAFELLEEQALRDGAKAVVWPFLTQRDSRLLFIGAARGYRVVFTGSAAVLDTPWASFDEYLADRSKQVRRTVRRELKQLAASDLRVSTEMDLRPLAATLDVFYRHAFRERNGRDPVLHPTFFPALAGGDSGAIWAQCTWQGTRLVGMSIDACAGGEMDGSLGGFAGALRGTAAYTNSLIYLPVRIAAARGASEIHLGATSLYPKLLRGARLEPRFTLVRGCSPAARGQLALLARAFAARTRRKEARQLDSLLGAERVAAHLAAVRSVPPTRRE
ncbi:MAG: peptidogalycan biosysnthesis protein [Longimicrobiaceae bacterium]